jgi:Arm DNA-binding domain
MLTDTQVRQAKPREREYKLADYASLYLLIRPNGSKLWRLDYRFGGKQKTLALDAYPIVTLAEARERRDAT